MRIQPGGRGYLAEHGLSLLLQNAGMHLMNQGRERILQTAETLKYWGIQRLLPVHCTGLEAIGKMKDVFGDKCLLMETGKVFEL